MSGSIDILDATRPTTTDNFSALGRTYTTLDCTGADELDPFVTADGLELYFSQTINGLQRIVRATRLTRSAAFGAAAPVTELDSGRGDADPTLSADGRVIIFSSNRTTTAGASTNLWYATRAGRAGTFGEPKPVPDANSDNQDGDPWISHDGCRIYFSSTRSNNFDVWTATVE
jgi:Tol biopolymer transport system component